jgi:hypothetical protein
MKTNWNDKELNPAGIEVISPAPPKQVQVSLVTKPIAHFKNNSGHRFVCALIGDKKYVFRLGNSSYYEEVTDKNTRDVIIMMTKEICDEQVKEESF